MSVEELKNIKVLFIGTFADGEYYDNLIKSGVYNQQAANSVEKFYIEGLNKYFGSVEVVSGLVTKTYPMGKKIIFRNHNSNYNTIEVSNIKFLNLPYLNIISQNTNFIRWGKKWINEKKNDNVLIVVYSLRIPFLRLAKFLKSNLPNSKIICIVPDLPLYMHSGKSLKNIIKSNLNNFCINKYLDIIDGFILYTDKMADALNIRNRPYQVIEGIFDNKWSVKEYKISKDLNSSFKVVYAGGVYKEYGVDILVKGFLNANLKNTNLYIYGDGKYVKDILELERDNDNIHYCGMVNRKELRNILCSADLLVNPRPSFDEFTKYSCPSKTLEYMSTGVPVLMTRLEGIPEEYYNYAFLIKDESIEGIKNELKAIVEKDRNELVEKGLSAKKFIEENKNIKSQMRKLISLFIRL